MIANLANDAEIVYGQTLGLGSRESSIYWNTTSSNHRNWNYHGRKYLLTGLRPKEKNEITEKREEDRASLIETTNLRSSSRTTHPSLVRTLWEPSESFRGQRVPFDLRTTQRGSIIPELCILW